LDGNQPPANSAEEEEEHAGEEAEAGSIAPPFSFCSVYVCLVRLQQTELEIGALYGRSIEYACYHLTDGVTCRCNRTAQMKSRERTGAGRRRAVLLLGVEREGGRRVLSPLAAAAARATGRSERSSFPSARRHHRASTTAPVPRPSFAERRRTPWARTSFHWGAEEGVGASTGGEQGQPGKRRRDRVAGARVASRGQRRRGQARAAPGAGAGAVGGRATSRRQRRRGHGQAPPWEGPAPDVGGRRRGSMCQSRRGCSPLEPRAAAPGSSPVPH
jgi:hypothetical protein